MEKNNTAFQYTYSAKEQAELKRIREKYTAKTEPGDKMEEIRRLDASVTQRAQTVSLIFGVIGTLILGTGMSLCMTDFAAILGSHRDMAMVFGIIIGVLGGAIAALAYPMYRIIYDRARKRVAPKILQLTDELMK